MYLHRILTSHNDSWVKKTLLTLDNMGIGWSKSIRETLRDYSLTTNFDEIRSTTRRQWKRVVDAKTEVQNKRRLIDECHKKEGNKQIEKTKTRHIVNSIKSDTYMRSPTQEILKCNKQETKTLIIARFGMLECGPSCRNEIKGRNPAKKGKSRISFFSKGVSVGRTDV